MRSSDVPKNVLFTFVTDSQELDCICAYLGITQAREHITAALVAVAGGDYQHVLFTEGTDFKRSTSWTWEPAEYYADDIPDELDLQE